MDDELRRLERAAATDLEARERWIRERQRTAPEPPGDVTLHHPFPIRLPFPASWNGRIFVPLEVGTWEDETVLTLDRAQPRPGEIVLRHLPAVRTPADVEAHARAEKRRSARGPVHACGAGQRLSINPVGGGGLPLHYLISPGGAQGAVQFHGDFVDDRFEVGSPGAWAGAPLVAGAPPWEVGRPAWTLVLPRVDARALQALRDQFALSLDALRAFKQRRDGALFLGFRGELEKARRRLAERSVEALVVWPSYSPTSSRPCPTESEPEAGPGPARIDGAGTACGAGVETGPVGGGR